MSALDRARDAGEARLAQAMARRLFCTGPDHQATKIPGAVGPRHVPYVVRAYWARGSLWLCGPCCRRYAAQADAGDSWPDQPRPEGWERMRTWDDVVATWDRPDAVEDPAA